MERKIFYPNKLTIDQINELLEWQLRIAIVHFSPLRTDCVRLNYGYEFKNNTIYVVADNIDGVYPKNREISIKDDIDINDLDSILKEIGESVDDIFRKYLNNYLS